MPENQQRILCIKSRFFVNFMGIQLVSSFHAVTKDNGVKLEAQKGESVRIYLVSAHSAAIFGPRSHSCTSIRAYVITLGLGSLALLDVDI